MLYKEKRREGGGAVKRHRAVEVAEMIRGRENHGGGGGRDGGDRRVMGACRKGRLGEEEELGPIWGRSSLEMRSCSEGGEGKNGNLEDRTRRGSKIRVNIKRLW